MLNLTSIFLLLVSLPILSCDRVKQKYQQASNISKDIAANQGDRVFPTYDADKSDTRHNKRRFQEHLEVKLTSDVNDIYAYGDFLGVGYKVLIAFSCDSLTI